MLKFKHTMRYLMSWQHCCWRRDACRWVHGS